MIVLVDSRKISPSHDAGMKWPTAEKSSGRAQQAEASASGGPDTWDAHCGRSRSGKAGKPPLLFVCS